MKIKKKNHYEIENLISKHIISIQIISNHSESSRINSFKKNNTFSYIIFESMNYEKNHRIIKYHLAFF